ncbi:electron transport protein [Caldalkalibacillus salinus]|uniref:electron transport protein n=1 Tax=Caldalkalibacillus salinus TaxID=2803787 RepID=UPI001923390B|nr:electron transport protein [Caldalkalibacillus salinus]
MKKWLYLGSGLLLLLILIGVLSFQHLQFTYGYIPDRSNVMDGGVYSIQQKDWSSPAYDLWGTYFSPAQAKEMLNTDEGKHLLSAENGAVKIDQALLKLGREAFYQETFGNEVFLTDIMGVLDGPLKPRSFIQAIMDLQGEGTTNLRVPLAEDITIGGREYKKGEKVDTGLDVPKGAYTPLGMPVSVSDGRLRVGISCAACHASVDPVTKEVVEGAPNLDINTGLIMALASNSAAYFTNTDIEQLERYIQNVERTVETTDGKREVLPDPDALEKAVDETLVKWPKGNFDSTIDLVSNPTQIPDSFTFMDHPYGWSGFAFLGPFKGLSSLNNNVHAQNSDSLGQIEQSDDLFNIDREVYIATILQRAANPSFRYDPASNQKPSEFFASVDPTPGMPGVNEMVKPTSFPRISLFTPNGTIVGTKGHHVGEEINAMSAWQNTLRPPQPPMEVDEEKVKSGRDVFERAGCMTCHAGDYFTNHQVLPVEEIQTEPSRAKAFKDTEPHMVESYTYTPDTPIPVPEDAKKIKVPMKDTSEAQARLALAHGDTEGGYKVKGLVGLYWTPPYLHDGGVAVGEDIYEDLGLPGTLLKGQSPDPKNSLRAIVDRELRAKVIEANQKSQQLEDVHVTGEGHEYWVDTDAGFTADEQEALIHYLLTQTSSFPSPAD